MWPVILISIYCLLVALASLAGGMVPSWLRLTHTRMQLVLSFVGGIVLGVGMLHLLPHSAAETQSLDQTVWAALAGLLAMFFLIRTFQVHHHGPVQEEQQAAAGEHAAHDCDHHDHASEHRHEYPTDGEPCVAHRHPYSWIGLGIGLTMHTVMDGMAIAASVTAAALRDGSSTVLLGLGTFLAVLLHKPLDAMSITTVMAAGGWSARTRLVINVLFAAMNAVGAAGFYWGLRFFAEDQHVIIGWALGFSAGLFLCIALADILPEIQFHAHDRAKLSAALVAGVLCAYAIGFAESPHQHGYDGPSGTEIHHEHAEPHEH